MAAKTKEVELKNETAVVETVRPMSRTERQDTVAEARNVAELRSSIGTMVDWSDIETSFEILKASAFEGKPCVIGAFNFNTSTKFLRDEVNSLGEVIKVPGEFVSMLVAGYDPATDELTSNWVIVNDGSVNAGIRKQLEKYIDKTTGDPRTAPAIRASNGFRKSEYPLTEEQHGTVGTGTTWFIA
jgi:hypothetical protein